MGDQPRNLDQIVELLDSSGVLGRLQDEAQAARELERAELLAKLAEVEKADKTLGQKLAVEIALAAETVAQAEGKIGPAKARLNELTRQNSHLGVSAQNLRGKLRRLADPALDQASRTLDNLFNKARNSFAGHDVVRRIGRAGRKTTESHSNAPQIAEVLARCRAAQLQIDALRESPRPDNLAEVLSAITDPIRADVRKLAGLG